MSTRDATATLHFTVRASGCWEWTGALTADGYGRASGKQAHRAAYEAIIGPIPDGLTLDHLCRNKACVFPGHMEPVTPAENARRAKAAQSGAVCENGHYLTAENTRDAGGGNKCRICYRNYMREYMRARIAKASA